MTSFHTWDEVVCCVAESRDNGRMLTNFFPDENRMARWCENGSFTYEERGETTFFVRRQETFFSLYFLSASVEAFTKALTAFMIINNLGRLVVDVLGRDNMREPLEGVLKSKGFMTLTTLQRMSRRTPADKYVHESGIDVAKVDDAAIIHNLLTTNFIAEEEQLPSLEEVQDWITAQSILVSRGGEVNDINGFIIFDLSPAALYLRYWFVSRDARGSGIGGKLMRSMFAMGSNTKRQYFWVKTDNENAIKRYQHYGFEFEELKDTVLAYGQVNGKVNA